MKKLFILSLIALLMSACDDSEDAKVFKIDPTAKVYVKGQASTSKSANHLTPLEVVKRATVMNGYNQEVAGTSYITWTWVGKDTLSPEPALLRWGRDIIYDTDGYGNYGLQNEFIYAYDLVICSGAMVNGLPKYDTLAYIPNSNITNARAEIIQAYESKDTSAVYDIFKNAFKFIPITGAEWRALKAQGLN